MSVIETFLAATGLAVCGVMLFRLFLKPRHQRVMDTALLAIATFPRYLVHKVRASRGAAQAIRRAKERGSWEGNVYTPSGKSPMRRPRKPH
jgi:hypothetical protein